MLTFSGGIVPGQRGEGWYPAAVVALVSQSPYQPHSSSRGSAYPKAVCVLAPLHAPLCASPREALANTEAADIVFLSLLLAYSEGLKPQNLTPRSMQQEQCQMAKKERR